MKRSFLVGAGAVVGVTVAACALLDDPSQCSSDGDCARFGALCDLAQAVCVAPPVDLPGDGSPGPVDSGTAPSDAGVDVVVTPDCDVSPKPTANVGTGLPPGPDGGAQVSGSLTLGCEKDWVLEGPLVVPPNATLAIAPGTTIRAKKATAAAIIVQPGARIVASGQRERPIVMTVDDPAPQPGDWRGLFVLGNAPRTGTAVFEADPLMPYGGANADDDSGSLEFVRVEYAAKGIILGAVGRKTKIDSVQVRRSNDNCFVFAGGTADAKHLVCQHTLDEHFELAQGYTGRLQFLFGQKVAPGDGHNGILIDGAGTAPIVYNATVCGEAQAQNVQGYGLVFRNGARLDVNDAVIMGWATGLDAVGALTNPTQLRSSVIFGNATNPAYVEDTDAGGPTSDDDNGFDEVALAAGTGNRTTDPGIAGCHDVNAPEPWPGAALTNGAQAPPADGFFDTQTPFIGAFRDVNDTWMTGAWVRFAAN